MCAGARWCVCGCAETLCVAGVLFCGMEDGTGLLMSCMAVVYGMGGGVYSNQYHAWL